MKQFWGIFFFFAIFQFGDTSATENKIQTEWNCDDNYIVDRNIDFMSKSAFLWQC